MYVPAGAYLQQYGANVGIDGLSGNSIKIRTHIDYTA
jgi:hypothetical protein